MRTSTQSERKPRFFYGWVIVFACLLLSATNTGILSYFGALFVAPVTEDLGFARAQYSMYSTFATVTTMIAMPIIGGLYKKIHTKVMILLGAAIGAGALITFSSAYTLPVFYLGGILGGLAMSMFGGIPISILLSNWFNEKRGLVTGIAFTGSAIVSSVFSPTVSRIIVESGWRTAYLILAAALLIIVVPATLFLIRVKPSDMGLQPYGSESTAEKGSATQPIGFTRKEALKMPAFWMFGAALFLMGMFTFGTQQHLVAYWTQCGQPAEEAAKIYSAMMVVSMISKIGMGSVFDRFRARNACMLCGSIAVLAQVTLILCTKNNAVFVPAVFFGITTALQVLATSYLTGKFFGSADYGTLYGLANTLLFLGVSVGVTFSALVYDLTSGYTAVWTIYAVAAAVMTLLLVGADQLSIRAFREKLHTERER